MIAGTTSHKPRLLIITFCFVAYFGLFLVSKVIPSFDATPFIFALILTLPIVLLTLFALSTWSVVAISLSLLRKNPLGKRVQWATQVSAAGLIALVIFLLAAHFLPSALPTGSHLSRFDRAVWLDPQSADYVKGGITPRQKMLADAIFKLPGHNREELEQMLGASLKTEYFESSGRDLIYILGPERDSLFGIDSEWLLIWTDGNGKFQRYAITTD